MADRQILAAGTAPVPAGYTVPNSVELIPKAVHAIFDGSGAAGDFLPTLEIVSDGGVVVARAPVSAADAVTAGASVEVSWFPFVAKTAAAAAGSTPSVATFYTSASAGDTPITVNANSHKNIAFAHASLPADGSVTGPTFGNTLIWFTEPCIVIEALYTGWDAGAYPKAGVLGTDSRITVGDQLGFSNAGTDDFDSIIIDNAYTESVRMNAHINGDSIHGYVSNGAGVAHDVQEAWLVIYVWSAPGYTGGIPGYP